MTHNRYVAAVLRALRTLRRIVLVGLLAIAALFVLALCINAFDERPSPQTLAMLRPQESRYSPGQNIYLALAGFDAPTGDSMIAAGQARIARYDSQVDAMLADPLLMPDSSSTAGPASLKLAGSTDFLKPLDPGFWESVRASDATIGELLHQNQELYERYLDLFGLAGYSETARPSVMEPLYFGPMPQVRKLVLATVCAQLQSGDEQKTQTGLKTLLDDVELWRKVLRGHGGLVSKMIAVAYLQTDSLILADMIADPRTRLPVGIEDALPQFALSDWDIADAYVAEFQVQDFIFRQVQAGAESQWQAPDTSTAARVWNRFWEPIEMSFYKLNSTKNLCATLMGRFVKFAKLDPSTFVGDQARLRAEIAESSNLATIRTLYNPIGKILVAIAAPPYENYSLKAFDAAALQRLTRLSLEIRRQLVAPASIAEFMKLHPEWSTHPADGRPFIWDPVKSEIAIQTVAKQKPDRRFSVRVWRRANI